MQMVEVVQLPRNSFHDEVETSSPPGKLYDWSVDEERLKLFEETPKYSVRCPVVVLIGDKDLEEKELITPLSGHPQHLMEALMPKMSRNMSW